MRWLNPVRSFKIAVVASGLSQNPSRAISASISCNRFSWLPKSKILLELIEFLSMLFQRLFGFTAHRLSPLADHPVDPMFQFFGQRRRHAAGWESASHHPLPHRQPLPTRSGKTNAGRSPKRVYTLVCRSSGTF